RAVDANNNGVIDDMQNVDTTTNNDANNNGLSDAVELAEGGNVNSGIGVTPRDSFNTAGDNLPDFVDLDSDDDTIPDATEARATGDYVAYTGSGDAADSDDDGILDIYDDNTSFGSTDATFKTGSNAPNADADDNADAIPDYLDTDSDGDGEADSDEAGLITTAPTYADPDGSVNDPLGTLGLKNVDSDDTEVDFRSINVPPIIDLNSSADPSDTDRGFTSGYLAGDAPVNITDVDAGILEPTGDDVGLIYITPGNLQDGADENLVIAGQTFALDANLTIGGVAIPGFAKSIDIEYSDGLFTIAEVSAGVLTVAEAEAVVRSVQYQNTSATPTDGAGTDRTFDIQFAKYEPSTVIIDFEELTAGTRATAAQIGSDPWWASAAADNGNIMNAANAGPFNQTMADNATGNFIFHQTQGNVPNDERIVFGQSGLAVIPNTDYTVSIDLARQNAASAGPFEVLINGNSIGIVNLNSGPIQDW
ncbi:MAG: hypothetical protein AAFP90_21355, partial [Planctomycetota bacterium]